MNALYVGIIHNARAATFNNSDCWLAAIHEKGDVRGRVIAWKYVIWTSGECETEAEARAALRHQARVLGVALDSIEDRTDHAAIARRNAEEVRS